jgi:uncharacterized protein YkwD
MYRVIIPLFLMAALSGCSIGSTVVSTGFAGPVRTASIKRDLPPNTSLGRGSVSKSRRKSSKRAAKRTNPQVASLGKDSAPKGSYSTARRGALNDRNFNSVRLDYEKARKLINAYRVSKGLKPLKVDVQLTKAAKAHSRDLARWDRISHYGSDGSNPWDRVKRTGYNARLAAENVGTGQNSIEEVFKGWKKSPGHNKNLLLADAQQMGIALVYDPKTEFKTFWTLVIGSRL